MVSKKYMLDTIPSDNKTANINSSETVKSMEMKVNEEDNSLESVLSDLKLTGLYHCKFFLLIGLLGIISAQHSIHYIFSVENVGYRCKDASCETTDLSRLEQNSSIDLKCHKYDLLNQTGVCAEDNIDLSSATECSEWIYDKPNTFVADFDLGCEDWKRTLVGTMHSVGYMFGLLVNGPLSDKIGRKRLVIINIVLAGVFGVAKSMVTIYWIYIALETLEPMFGDCYAALFTMAVEMVTTKSRPAIILLLSVATAIGQILLAVLAYFTPSWRILLLTIYAPAFLFILFLFWMDESLRWQLINGKKTEAGETLRRAAKMNKITIDESRIVNLKCEKNTSNADLWTAIKVTVSSRKLLIRLLVCFCVWFTSLFNAYALLINSVSLEGNKYINYGLVSLSGLVAGFLLLLILTKFKRKSPLILSLTLTGLFCVSQSFVPKEYRWLSTLLYLCGKVNSSISLRISYLYTTELFPTYTRNTMLALCSSLGRTATILAPQTPLLLKYWSGLPSLLVGVLSLLTATVVTLMPDTSEDILPDNVKQAEAVGSKQKMKTIHP